MHLDIASDALQVFRDDMQCDYTTCATKVPTGDASPADGLEGCNQMKSGWGITSLVALGHSVEPIPGASFMRTSRVPACPYSIPP